MNDNKKIISTIKITAFSCLAIFVAAGANISLFCILAVARTTPPPIYPREYEPIQIVNLDLPEPKNVEPADLEAATEVIQLGPEPTDTEPPQPAADLTSQEFPHLSERINNMTFQLPGLPMPQANVSLLEPERAAPVGSVEKPASASRVDRLPAKIRGLPPRYPRWARRGKLEAVVTVRFIVTADGTVEEAKIHEINGDERFGDEAIRAISQWRFSPAIKAGKAVPCWCFQKVSFKFTG